MLQKCPAHRHWNVPTELDNEEVIDDSCDPSFSRDTRAETKSGKRGSKGSECSHRFRSVGWIGKGKLQLGGWVSFVVSLFYYGKLKRTYRVRRSRKG